MHPLGSHYILELYGCPADRIDDVAVVRSAIRAAALAANATLLGELCHRFHPHGVTALGLLAESHLSVHTWPELGYVACDVFTCGTQADPKRACSALEQAFAATRTALRIVTRGFPPDAGRPRRFPEVLPSASPGMFKLENVVQPYAWGSRTAIAELRGEPRSEGPEAELWIGAHPKGPSRIELGGARLPLDAAIARDPEAMLGAHRVRGYGDTLPYLVKLLAADAPLSLQTHPSEAQARRGFAAEDAAAIPRSAANRNYRDPHAKPELLCALTPFEALCGFRPIAELRTVFAALGGNELRTIRAALAASESPLPAIVELWSQPVALHRPLIDATLAACMAQRTRDDVVGSASRCALRLASYYPDDLGLVAAMMLQEISLAPGEALFLAPGQLHSYLSGFAIEVMANSDNVLRGGLTPKHIDVPEFLSVLDTAAPPVLRLSPRRIAPGHSVYLAPAAEFTLHSLEMGEATVRSMSMPVAGPEVLVCIAGRSRLRSENERFELGPGESAFIAGSRHAYTIEGEAHVFRVTVGGKANADG